MITCYKCGVELGLNGATYKIRDGRYYCPSCCELSCQGCNARVKLYKTWVGKLFCLSCAERLKLSVYDIDTGTRVYRAIKSELTLEEKINQLIECYSTKMDKAELRFYLGGRVEVVVGHHVVAFSNNLDKLYNMVFPTKKTGQQLCEEVSLEINKRSMDPFGSRINYTGLLTNLVQKCKGTLGVIE